MNKNTVIANKTGAVIMPVIWHVVIKISSSTLILSSLKWSNLVHFSFKM